MADGRRAKRAGGSEATRGRPPPAAPPRRFDAMARHRVTGWRTLAERAYRLPRSDRASNWPPARLTEQELAQRPALAARRCAKPCALVADGLVWCSAQGHRRVADQSARYPAGAALGALSGWWRALRQTGRCSSAPAPEARGGVAAAARGDVEPICAPTILDAALGQAAGTRSRSMPWARCNPSRRAWFYSPRRRPRRRGGMPRQS